MMILIIRLATVGCLLTYYLYIITGLFAMFKNWLVWSGLTGLVLLFIYILAQIIENGKD